MVSNKQKVSSGKGAVGYMFSYFMLRHQLANSMVKIYTLCTAWIVCPPKDTLKP